MIGSTKGAQRASSVPSNATASRLILGVALASMVVLTGGGPVLGARPTEVQSADPAGIGSALTVGDVLIDNGLSVRVPAPGETVWAAAEFADGTAQEILVTTALDGSVSVTGLGDERLLAPLPVPLADVDGTNERGVGSAECRDTSLDLFGWRTPSYRWSYSARTTPNKFANRKYGTKQILRAITRAARDVTNARNKCGRADRISAKATYIGRTWRRPAHRGASCGPGDGQSVIGWGYLPRASIAFMCVHSMTGGRTREADIVLSKEQPYDTKRSRCGGEFLIEAPMAHEFGHVFGLDHVGGYHLTMYPDAWYCSTSQASLGLGDLLGLERMY